MFIFASQNEWEWLKHTVYENSHSIRHILSKLENIMTTLADLKAAVDSETTVVASVVTLLDGIKQQLDAAISANDPEAIQAVADEITAHSKALSEAVVRNTPSVEPIPDPVPDPIPDPIPDPVPDPEPPVDPAPMGTRHRR